MLSHLSKSAKILLDILNDILDYSKIEAHKLLLEKNDLTLSDLSEHLKELFKPQANDKKLKLEICLDKEVPGIIVADELRLLQVLSNLIANAIKFTHSGGVSVDIKLKKRLDNNKAVLSFAVKDTGIGIDKENLEKLFVPFTQADVSITRNYGGSGLGLVISKRILEAMKSTLNVQSQKDKGSVFSFDIEVETKKKQAKEETTRQTKDKNIDFSGLHILLVEDNEINQEVAVMMLNNLGFEVDVARNGKDGVTRFDTFKNKYSAVLMDLQMPVMSGYEATQEIRKLDKKVPIIALTAAAMIEDKDKVLSSGMDDHLPKPLQSSELYKVLVKHIHNLKVSNVDKHEDEKDSLVLDYRYLHKNLGSKELMDRLLQKFLKQLNGEFSTIDKNVIRNDENAKTLIHTLKGASGNLGAKNLYAICQVIDKKYKLNEMVLSSDIEELTKAILDVKEAIQKLYAKEPTLPITHIQNNIPKLATLLIVDDSVTNIEILVDLLKDDYNIKVAKNGFKAIEISKTSHDIDLILLDIVMPDIDGYSVCKELKSDQYTHNIPIIFISANDMPQDEEYGLRLGAIDYIKKPFHPTIVKMRVKNHINTKLKSDMLEQLSMYDGLTHIPNRRYFDEHYEKLDIQAKKEFSSLAVMMIDIDYFKPYNDNYGHGKGDETLTKVATTLKSTLHRPEDLVARYGGEEFVVVLTDISQEDIEKIADRLVKNVQALSIEHNYSKTAEFVTISIGVGFREASQITDKQKLLKEADDALYKAKENGKNRYATNI
jgi:diguanylate cyclase (GGDEF)-like protein